MYFINFRFLEILYPANLIFDFFITNAKTFTTARNCPRSDHFLTSRQSDFWGGGDKAPLPLFPFFHIVLVYGVASSYLLVFMQ